MSAFDFAARDLSRDPDAYSGDLATVILAAAGAAIAAACHDLAASIDLQVTPDGRCYTAVSGGADEIQESMHELARFASTMTPRDGSPEVKVWCGIEDMQERPVFTLRRLPAFWPNAIELSYEIIDDIACRLHYEELVLPALQRITDLAAIELEMQSLRKFLASPPDGERLH